MLDIPKIQAVCRRASHWDLFGSPFGGSYVHMHLFRPVADPEELGLWEEEMGFSLPEDYRRYLTQLGNGGAGPYYGVLPFRFPLREAYKEDAIYSLGQEARFQEVAGRRYAREFEDLEALYEAYCAHIPEGERMEYDRFEEELEEREEREIYQVLYEHGLLPIGEPGGNGEIDLLLNGSHRGYVGGLSQEGDFSHLAPEFSLACELERWTPFANYLMEKYVDRAQALCDGLSAEKKGQALRERELVLAFQRAVEGKDQKEILHLLQGVDPKALFEKTTFFFQYHEKTLRKAFPEEPLVAGLYQGIEENRQWNYQRYHGFYDEEKRKVTRDGYEAHTDLPLPTFRQFFQTYVDMGEDLF